MSGRRRVLRAWAPAMVYMASIWILSSMRLHNLRLGFLPFADKGAHFIEYCVLGMLVAHAAMRTWSKHPRLRTACLALLIAFAWGVLDELHQAFVPGRASEVLDLVADFLGASTGAGLRLLAHRIRRRRGAGESSA